MKKFILPIVLGMFVVATAAAPLSTASYAQAPKPAAAPKKDPCAKFAKDEKKYADCTKREAKKNAPKPKKEKKEKKPAQ
jgi:hypothetical protein